MRYKIKSTGNVINAELTFVESQYAGDFEEMPDITPAEPVQPRMISVGSFFDRFGADKWSILASADPIVQALVKDCSVRVKSGINLDRPDVSGGVALLQAKGFSHITSAVITDPVLDHEKP